MNGTTGLHPAGSLGSCSYNITTNVTVNINERVNVTFEGGEPPFQLRRINDNGVECAGTKVNDEYTPSLSSNSFTWVVEKPYTSITGYPNGTTANLTYGSPGDTTVFVVVQAKDWDNGTWHDQETRYWTSPRYVMGDTPLPGDAARLGVKSALVVVTVALSCMLGMMM